MLSLQDVRQFALSLPDAAEQDHHGFPSFRVRSKIFMTQPDDDFVHVMVEPDDIREAVAEDGDACEEVWWGQQLSAVRVHLSRVDPALFRELVTDAWRRRAPKKLRAAFDNVNGLDGSSSTNTVPRADR